MLRLIRFLGCSPGTNALKWTQPVHTSLVARLGTFQPREFQYETSDGESGTLMHRFSRHVSLTKRDFTDKTKYGFRVSNFYPLPDVNNYGQQIRELATVDIAKLITFTTDFRSKTDFRSYTEIVNTLDEECVRRVPGATVYELLEMLHCFMYLLPNKIAQLKAYQAAMPKLIELFAGAENERDFLSIVFFLGLWKRNQTGMVLMKEFLQQYLDRYLTADLSRMDFVILANATYKTSLRLADESQPFKTRLISEIVGFDNADDPALLVTLIKCARMNRLSSGEIIDKIRTFTESNLSNHKQLDFRGLSHLFAYMADNRVKDDALIGQFVEGCWTRFEQEVRMKGFETRSQSCRPKDIATYVWSCATLGVPMQSFTEVNLNMLEKAIRLKVEAGEYRYAPDVLVDTILSLWICDRKSIGLFRLLFKDRALVQNLRKERAKLESRKDLLLSCAEIDLPEAWELMKAIRKPGDAFALERRAPDFLIRPALKKVAECLSLLKEQKQLPIASISFNLPVKHLNIAGVLVQMCTGGVRNLDVLDDKHCLSDHESPVGLMKLKSRMLADKSVDRGMVNVCKINTPEELATELKRILVVPDEQNT
uniref:FAST kinase leucine-rich domain-containing protein n=1 Tax=Anopheles farauti TaxID=69004 RepID=A0A182QYE7_9DIPT